MLLKIVSLVTVLLICAIGVDATSIEKNPNKRKGAGAPFQIRRDKKWGYMDKAGKVIIQPHVNERLAQTGFPYSKIDKYRNPQSCI